VGSRGRTDSAAAAYGAARAAASRHRRVAAPAPGARHARHGGGVPPAGRPAGPAAREAGSARAQALLAAGDSAAALDAFAQAGRSLDLARLALAHGDSSRARDALYGLMARAPRIG